MKIYCAWCLKETGTLTLVNERIDCDKSGDSYGGICPAHRALVLEGARIQQPTLTTADVAEQLGVSRSRVLAIIRIGKLPAKKIGRQWMVSELALGMYKPGPVGWPKGRSRKQS